MYLIIGFIVAFIIIVTLTIFIKEIFKKIDEEPGPIIFIYIVSILLGILVWPLVIAILVGIIVRYAFKNNTKFQKILELLKNG